MAVLCFARVLIINYGLVACVFVTVHTPPMAFGSSSSLEALPLEASSLV
jgi:hypothetical protein